MEDEILNIEYHVKRIVLKALNKTRFVKQAADMVGVSERTLHRYKKDFNIGCDKKRNEFYLKGERPIILK